MEPLKSLGNCCITGAAGFIGAHVARALVTRGVNCVTGIDSLLYGHWDNLVSELDHVNLITSDIVKMDEDEMAGVLEGTDTLFHFAAQKLNNLTSESDLLATNVTATERLVRVAGNVGVRRIVFASSLYAYGRRSGAAMAESDIPEPSTLYGVSKLTGEGILRTAAAATGVDTVSLRLFFVYGPRQYVGTGYPSVIIRNYARMLAGDAPVIFGSGNQALDYTYVDDLVDAILRAAQVSSHGEVINLGSGVSTSLNHLTAMMKEICGCKLATVHADPDWTDGTNRFAQVTNAANILSWQASTPMVQGLENTYRWLKDKV